MSAKNEPGDGYLLYRALSDLRHVAAGTGDGWTTIRQFWEALAGGNVDDLSAAQWAQEIAKRVVRDVLGAQPQERPKRAMVALGLVGAERIHQREREHLQMLAEFGELVDEDTRQLRPTRRTLAKYMLDNGYFKGLKEAQAMKAIEYIEKNRPPKK
jgi:hypothetical protein